VIDVQGIGGVFLYADDADALASWYRDVLGLPFPSNGPCYIEWPSADREPSTRTASTVLSIFQATTPLPKVKTARINLRVRALDEAVTRLRAAGLEVEYDPEQAPDYGRFAWLHDPEGNRLELWEPPEA
jgi:predicted enzyme related to lactoylglutathione lyase